jgi:hypothetical protein
MEHSQSELQVITFVKNLCSYVMTITQKSPKQFRFSLIGRMQGYVLDIVEELYYANDIYVTPTSRSGWAQRLAHQRKAMATLKLLSWGAQVSMEQGAIQPKQFQQIIEQCWNTQNLLGAWIISDQKRLSSSKTKQERMEQGSASE